MKVAYLAQAYDVDIAPHGPQEVHVHLVAAIANGLILEFYRDTGPPHVGEKFITTPCASTTTARSVRPMHRASASTRITNRWRLIELDN